MPRRKIVGVLGSGTENHSDLATVLGRWIAHQGWDLLTGAGQGVMAAVSQAFYDVPGRRGLILGVVPAGKAASLYPNPWVEVAIFTHLSGADGPTSSSSRNHINVLSSDVLVALPGQEGTRAEIELAVRYKKSIIAYWPEKAPRFPESVPVAKELCQVQDFVLDVMGASPA